MRKYMVGGVLALAVTTGSMTGCGDSVEMRLQRAQIALSTSKPDQALEFASSVLKEKPNDEKALEYKAKAELALFRLAESRKSIESLMAAKPDAPTAHELMVDWSFRQMSQSLKQTDFLTDANDQAAFEEALALGQKQADWMDEHGMATQAAFARARFAGDADAVRYQAMLNSKRGGLANAAAQIDPTNQDPALAEEIQKLTAKVEELYKQSLAQLDKVLEKEPRHFEAIDMMTRLLSRRGDWAQLWVLGQKVSELTDVPVGTFERQTLVLMRMPNSVHTSGEKLALGRKIEAAVSKAGRNSHTFNLTSARLCLLAGEYEKAQALLEKVAAARKNDNDARYLLAESLVQQKKYAEARPWLEKLVTQAPRSAPVQYLYGVTLRHTNDAALARQALRSAADLDPKDTRARMELISLMADEGRIGDAGTEIQDNYTKNPGSALAIRQMMQFYQVQGLKEDVKAVLARTEKLSPLTEEHLSILADGYTYLQDFAKAEGFAAQWVKKKPDAIESNMKLAETRLMQGKDDQVKQMLIDLKKKFPTASSADQMLGRLYLQRNSFDKANEHLQAVVDAEPRNIEARLMLARSLASLSMMDEAIEQVDKVLEQQPDSVPAHALAARIYQFTQQPEKATQHLSKIDESKVDEASMPTLLAQIKLKLDDADAAAAICNRAIAAGNTDPALRLLLADIYSRKNEFAQAESNLQALVRTQPTNAQAWSMLARFYVNQKQAERGLSEIAGLQTATDPAAETYSRLSQAVLLVSLNKPTQAIEKLTPIYEPLIKVRSRLALSVADAMGRIHISQGNTTAAAAVFEPLINAGFLKGEASLRQIDLLAPSIGPEKTVERLDGVAAKLTPEDSNLRYAVMRRYQAMGRFDKLMKMIDEWSTTKPNEPVLLRWKAETFMQMQQPDKAVATLNEAIKIVPDSPFLYQRLGQAYVALADYPAAQKAMEAMGKIDAGARITALATMGQMYVGLGLNHQAAATFEELEKAGKPTDPRVVFAIGQSFAILGKDGQAKARLAEVPSYAPQYVASQLLLARIEQRSGNIADAKARLEKLTSDPRTSTIVTTELLNLNLRSSSDEELIELSNQRLNLANLPETTRLAWLRLRVTLAARKHNWEEVLKLVETLHAREADSVKLAGLRAAVLLYLKRTDAAAAFLKPAAKLSTSPLLAIAMNRPVDAESPELKSPLLLYVNAMARGDLAAARSAVEQLPPMRTLYRSDLSSICARPDAATPEMAERFRKFGVALVAEEVGLPQLTEAICADLIKELPTFAPAYGLWVQAMIGQEMPLDKVIAQTRQAIPASALSVFLEARQRSNDKDYSGAVKSYRALLEREPQNVHGRYELTQALQNDKKIDEAVTELQKLQEPLSGYELVARNDLAYLLAENFPARREEARKLAAETIKAQPNFAPLQDTMGWIEHQSGNDQAAIQLLNKALPGLSSIPEVQYHVGAVYKSLGNAEWAKFHLTEAALSPAGGPVVEKAKLLLGN